MAADNIEPTVDAVEMLAEVECPEIVSIFVYNELDGRGLTPSAMAVAVAYKVSVR